MLANGPPGRLPDLDDQPEATEQPGAGAGVAETDPGSPAPMLRPDERAITTIRFRPAALLTSTGELTAGDLRRPPGRSTLHEGRSGAGGH
jgi:hypothetical protein